MNSIYFNLICLLVFINVLITNCTQQLKVKVIEEPINFEFQSNLANQRLIPQNELKTLFKPAPFAGPEQMEQLNGKCFQHLNKNYKWIVCPFQNVTQFEQNMRWNPYKGVLGVWYEWNISDNKFKSMMMLNGDECGSIRRSTQVNLICNKSNNQTEIIKTSEPETCQYEIDLSSPFACENNVYPHLNESLKSKWDLLYTEFIDGLITEKMYKMALKQIFQEAGYQHDKTFIEQLKLNDDLIKLNDFSNLTREQLEDKLKTCENENKQLKERLTRLTYSFS